MSAADPRTVYRDATISRDTRDRLANALHATENYITTFLTAAERIALADVIAKWDANEATEFVLTDSGYEDAA